MAEQNYLLWKEVRKNQNDDEYRWALNEMRRFYLLTHQKEKLEKNEEEWLIVLDRQLDQGYICPWFDWENPTPEDNYQYSMKPVFFELVGNDHYFLAEKSFLHIIKKCPSCYSDWETGDYIYSVSERSLLSDKDTATLAVWYQHWYNALEKFGPGKKVSLETFSNIAQSYTSRYFHYDQYFDRFYPMMMSYTQKLGGDTAVHDLLLTSSRRYVASLPVKIKLNLFLILSCLKVKDEATIEKTYKQTDKLLKDYVSGGGSKYDLLMLLVNAKSKSDDKRYVKWCNKNIKSLN